ncbi:MAG TPA: M23 family metallopeptidase [Thermoanaerobaculia bacterium]|nr:M23 family metallopeptidase [Thermoanaerobaculia bacterium]
MLAAGLTVWLASASFATSILTAPPASVVRWAGNAIERCTFDGRTFPPRDGACLLPVDLLATGTLTAERVRAGVTETLAIEVGAYPYPVQRLTIDDPRRTNPNAEDLARIERESARIAELWTLDGAAHGQLPLSPPLEALPPGGRFGAKRIINGNPSSPHSGLDYAANQGTPVLAAGDGAVRLAEEHFFAGNSVFLDHGDGLVTMYFHLHEIFVEPGEKVTRGAVIGTVGSTGRSTGPHLHFGARWRGARIDPALLLGPVERYPNLE